MSTEIKTTNFNITSTGQSFTIPGDWSPEQLVNMYSATISGLGGMDSSVSVEGEVRTVTFRPRTGSKG